MGLQANMVREDILERVMARRLMPGDRIDEEALRARLSVSTTPVREALIALEATGVIERRPRDGARVAALDLEGVAKMVEAMAEAEASVAALAARRINRAQADALDRAASVCLERVAAGDGANYYDANLGFHRALLAAAGNEHLEAVVLGLANRLVAYLAARHALPGEPARSAREHREIAEAVRGGDSDRARALMIRHVNFGEVAALDVMNAVAAR